MPAELLGGWSPLPKEFCGVFTIRPDGFQSIGEEGYTCKLNSIKEVLANNRQWEADFTCSGESNRPTKMRSALQLRDFEGLPLLVVVEQWKTQNISVMRPCGR
jgi:hypothetical protein